MLFKSMNVTNPIDVLDETLECVRLRWCTDDDEEQRLRRYARTWQYEGLRRREWFGMKHLEAF